MYRTLVISLFFIMILISDVLAEGVIIVNKNNPAINISSSQLKQIYNGNTKLWEDKKKVIPVDLPDAHPLAIKFAKTILGVDMDTKRKFWIEKLFAGLGIPPHQEKNEASVISFVALEPGAIGYVDKGSVGSSVKIITVDGKGEF